MSTSSANTTPMPTRRKLIAQAAAVPASVVAATLPALAAPGDAHLFELGRRLARLNALAAEADQRVSEGEARYESIKPSETPEALIVRSDDKLIVTKRRPEMKGGVPTGRFEYEVDVEKVNRQLASWSKYEIEEIRCVDPNMAAAIVRLREMVDCQTAWRDAQNAAWRACGMLEVDSAWEEAHDRCAEVRLEMTRCPATTMAGVMLKVRVAMNYFGDTLAKATEQIDLAIEESGSGEQLALSVLKDLARMAECNAMGGLDA